MHSVRLLGIEAQISAFSYISPEGDVAYLEEDCDAQKYLDAAKARGWNVQIVEKHSNARAACRDYPRFPGA